MHLPSTRHSKKGRETFEGLDNLRVDGQGPSDVTEKRDAADGLQ